MHESLHGLPPDDDAPRHRQVRGIRWWTTPILQATRRGAEGWDTLSIGFACGSTATPCTKTISPPSHPDTPSSNTAIAESQTGGVAPGEPDMRSHRLVANRATTTRLMLMCQIPIL